MSRTDKDVPYWVRLNNEGDTTDHDHVRLGKPITKRYYVLDDNGDHVMESIPLRRRAGHIVARNSYGGYDRTNYYNDPFRTWETYPEPIMREAHRLVNADRPNEWVLLGYQERPKTELRVVGYVADHCTEGEKLRSRDDWHYTSAMPCQPSLHREPWWRYGPTPYRAAEHDAYYTGQRGKERKHMRRLTKEWNGGADLEDWDEPDNLTDNRHSYIYW